MPVLILRGLPGCGKSSLAAELTRPNLVFSADAFMVDRHGKYTYNPARIGECHARCQLAYENALIAEKNNLRGRTLVVDNTNCSWWELTPYITLATAYGAQIEIIDLYDGGLSDEALERRNLHGVPDFAVGAMRARYDSLDVVVRAFGMDVQYLHPNHVREV